MPTPTSLHPDVTVGQAIGSATHILAAAGVDTPRLDAQLILAWILKVRREDLAREPERVLNWRERTIFDKAISLRAKRRPLPYITAEAPFYGRTFTINKAVLVPRPETEILVSEALRRIETIKDPIIADICTGSGCVGVTIACERIDAHVWLSDVCPLAMIVARKNAVRNNVAERTYLAHGDLLAPLLAESVIVDALVANPPYVRPDEMDTLQPEVRDYEPGLALVGENGAAGEDGTALHRRLIAESRAVLRPGGWLLMEVGRGQAEQIAGEAALNGYGAIEITNDFAGIGRVVTAQSLPA